MRRALPIAIPVFAAILGLSGALSAPASAQTALVTDYANYPDTPQAQLPAGCDGGGLFHSETYSLNGGTPVSDPRSLPELNEGDVVTMSWNATTSECVGAPIVLDVKVSKRPTFNPGDDQIAYVPYAIATADGGPGSVRFTMPRLADRGFNCAYQLDSIVGLPLAIVGPSGSDYSAGIGNRGPGGRTTLIGFRNGAYETCAAPPTTTTTAPETTTTTAPVTTTTAPAPTTTEAPPTTTAPVAVTTQPETLQVARTVPATTPARTGSLAATGPGEAVLWALTAVGVMVVGYLVVNRTNRRINKRTQP